MTHWTDSEEWDDNDLDTLVTECERCGETRACQLVEDPFVVEGISDDAGDGPEWWCRPCWQQRQDDV